MAHSINDIVARNLAYFMERSVEYKNANALGNTDGLSPNTVRHLLGKKQRTVTAKKPVGYPTLDKLVAVAGRLKIEVWQLLHPEIELVMAQLDAYKQMEKTLKESAAEHTRSVDGTPPPTSHGRQEKKRTPPHRQQEKRKIPHEA